MYHDNRHPTPYQVQPMQQVGGFMAQPEIPFGPKLYGATYEQPKSFAFKKGPLGPDGGQVKPRMSKWFQKGSGGVPGQKVAYPDAKYQMYRKPMEERFLAHKSGFAQVLK